MKKCDINCCKCPKQGTCIDQQQQLIEKLFNRYGSYKKDMSEKVIRIYEQHPEKLHTEKDILYYFDRAQSDIEQLQECILELKAYEKVLTDRYNFIKTSPVKNKIRLQRQKSYYDKKVYYYIEFYSVNLNDGHEQLTHSIKYTGKERKQALEHFENLKKLKKDTIFEKDIERSRWEK